MACVFSNASGHGELSRSRWDQILIYDIRSILLCSNWALIAYTPPVAEVRQRLSQSMSHVKIPVLRTLGSSHQGVASA